MKPTNLFLLIAFFSFFLFFSPSFAHNKSYGGAFSFHKSFEGTFSKVYSFGDSSSDTGNAYALACSSGGGFSGGSFFGGGFTGGGFFGGGFSGGGSYQGGFSGGGASGGGSSGGGSSVGGSYGGGSSVGGPSGGGSYGGGSSVGGTSGGGGSSVGGPSGGGSSVGGPSGGAPSGGGSSVGGPSGGGSSVGGSSSGGSSVGGSSGGGSSVGGPSGGGSSVGGSSGGGGSAGGSASSSHDVSGRSSESNKRLCNGRLVIDFLCEALHIPHSPPYKGTSANFTSGANFAIAGATTLASNFFSSHTFNPLIPLLKWKQAYVNLETQVDWFNKFIQEVECKGESGSSCKPKFENALFWIGPTAIDDYARMIHTSFSLESLPEMCMGHTSKLIQTLLDNGAKYIVVQGLPPIGCLPLGLFSSKLLGRDKWGCAAAVNSATMVYNQVLQMTLEIIRKKNPHCTIVYADYWNAFLEILTNPAKYHFEETFKTCCGGGGGEFNFHLNSLCGSKGTSTCNDASKYINWDGIHLTEAMHWQITDLFLNQGYCRPSFNELIKNKFGM
ncbi:hypothetical protein U1Q18_029053 [Sarracenia purpurea var. burkii]